MRSVVAVVRRGLWLVGGLVAVVVGAIGIVVPGLPTTIFFIIAAGCFARSSDRLEAWVLGLPRIGPAVRRYRAGLGMPRTAKRFAIGSIIVFSVLSIVLIDALAFRIGVAAVAAVGIWYVAARVPTTPADVALGDIEG